MLHHIMSSGRREHPFPEEHPAGTTHRVGHLVRMSKGKGILENELELLCQRCGEKVDELGCLEVCLDQET